MSLVQKSTSRLYLGVSEQEPSNRLEGQVSASVNMIHTVEKGVSRRNPTQAVADLGLVPHEMFMHSYDRGDGEEAYIILVESGSLKVFDKEGVQRTVTASSDVLNYLVTTLPPAKSFKALTVGDTTFIVNNTVTCLMAENYDGLLGQHKRYPFYWVKRTFDNGKSQGYTYEVTHNGVTRTATGTNSQTIASSLVSSLGTGWVRFGSIVFGNNVTTTAFTGSDSYGGTASLPCWGVVQDVKDLPLIMSGAENGRELVVKVAGDPTNAYTKYWVKFEDGVWNETTQPYMRNTINNATMPLKLTSLADGTFLLERNTWDKRTVGDEDTAPEPSFIGNKITDIFFFKNRLCLVSGENVVMSQIGSYRNFFPTTVTDVLDSDPIDVSVDSNKVSFLNHAVPFDDRVILTSTEGQFSLQADKVLSPTDVSISSTSSYSSLRFVKPLALGDSIYFLSESTKGISLREYYIDSDRGNTSTEVSEHIPSFIPHNIVAMVGNTNQDIICILSKDTPDTLYIYKYFYNGEERVQTAWFKWKFNTSIFNITMIDNYLYLLLDRNNSLHIEKLDYSNKDEGVVYLDRGLYEYDSYVQLTELILKDNNNTLIQSAKAPIMYRTIQLATTAESRYQIKIDHTLNNNGVATKRTRWVKNFGVKDNKWIVQGKAKELDIEIHSVEDKPLEFYTYTIEANYNSRATVL